MYQKGVFTFAQFWLLIFARHYSRLNLVFFCWCDFSAKSTNLHGRPSYVSIFQWFIPRTKFRWVYASVSSSGLQIWSSRRRTRRSFLLQILRRASTRVNLNKSLLFVANDWAFSLFILVLFLFSFTQQLTTICVMMVYVFVEQLRTSQAAWLSS